MNVEQFKPLNKDLLIERVDPSQFLSSSSLILDFKDTDMELNYFRVVKVADKVTDVKEGDYVLVSWERVTPPFQLDSGRYGITSIDEVVGVIDDE